MARIPMSLVHSRRKFAAGMAALAVVAGGRRFGAVAQEGTPGADGMTLEDSQQLLDAYINDLFTGGDFGQYLSEDAALVHMDTGDSVTGRDAIVDAIIQLHTVQFAAMPEVTNTVVGAGTAGLEIVFVGTHTGEFAGFPASDTLVEVPYSAFYTMEGGEITEIRLYGLATGLVTQLSVEGTPEATPVT
jgi:hypothetical protein